MIRTIMSRFCQRAHYNWAQQLGLSPREGDCVAARWVAETPELVWEAVRSAVLRC